VSVWRAARLGVAAGLTVTSMAAVLGAGAGSAAAATAARAGRGPAPGPAAVRTGADHVRLAPGPIAGRPGAGHAVSVLAPKISSVSPGEGAPGWLVTVAGHYFTGVTRVTFGGVAARFTIVSSSKITATIPAGAASGWLVVRNSAGRARAAFTVTPAGTLVSGETMPAGDSLTSADGHFQLTMQGDGNLVEYVANGGHALWNSGTAGHAGAYVIMQSDGNLVVYLGSTPLWNSGTGGQGPASLSVQTDANLVVYQGTTALWSSGSYDYSLQSGETLHQGQSLESSDRHFLLAMQSDGNLVEYVAGTGHAVWDSGTAGHAGAYVIMQADGNLVVYLGSTPLWNSGTGGRGQAMFAIQPDANLVIYQGVTPIWASRSYDNTLQPGEELSPGWYLESGNGYQLVMQGDGNLVEYYSGSAVWSSGTAGNPGAYVIMQGDGNLVIYRSGTALWFTGTAGHPGAYLADQQDGNQVVYAGSTALWASNSGSPHLTLGAWPGTAGPGAAAQYYGYPYPDPPACTDGGSCIADKWGFYEGQCVSWVAYRLNQLNGIAFSNSFGGGGRWGNASNWGPHAQALGIPVNGTPAVGSVAWYAGSSSSPFGHVAYVEKVNSPTSVIISEMNYDNDNGFRVWTITTSSGHWPTSFIHIHDR
jgi:surface antigen